MTVLLFAHTDVIITPDPPPTGAWSLKLTNAGAGPLTIGIIELVQSDTDFTIVADSASNQTIPPGQSRSVAVAFAPDVGAATATLRIPSTDPDGLTQVVITGTGIASTAPEIAVDPPSWAAGSVAVAAGRPYKDVTVTNIGDAQMTVGTVSVTGADFVKSLDTASSAIIQPGQSKTFRLTFTPTTTGAKTGSVTIPSDGGADVVVSLTGTGTKTLTVFPTSWNAGNVQTTGGTSTLTAVVKSTGTVPVTVGTVTVTGTGFTKGTDNASSQVIDPIATETVLVTFDPTTSTAHSGSLTVPSDATGSPVVVALSGTGVADPVVPPTPPTPEPDDEIEVYRFYLGRQAAPSGVSITDSGWGRHTTDADRALTIAKGGASPSWATTVNLTHGSTARHGRWIGPPMAAQATATSFTCYVTSAYRASVLGANVTSALRFGIWRVATGLVSWQNIMAHSSNVDPWREAEDALPRRVPGGAGATWWFNYAAFEEGDRLVVEVGARGVGPSGITAGTRIRYGGASTDTDLADSQATADLDGASWISFTDPLYVLDV